MKIVEDEDGYLWIVGPGDPAEGLLRDGALVIPRRHIISGTYPNVEEWEGLVHRFEKAYRATGDEGLRLGYLRAVRLWDTAKRLTVSA